MEDRGLDELAMKQNSYHNTSSMLAAGPARCSVAQCACRCYNRHAWYVLLVSWPLDLMHPCWNCQNRRVDNGPIKKGIAS